MTKHPPCHGSALRVVNEKLISLRKACAVWDEKNPPRSKAELIAAINACTSEHLLSEFVNKSIEIEVQNNPIYQ